MEHFARETTVSHSPENFRHPKLGHVDERLLLAGRNWRINLASVLIHNGIARVFPTLIPVALNGTRLVLVKAIPKAIGVFVLPLESPQRRVDQGLDSALIPCPMPKL